MKTALTILIASVFAQAATAEVRGAVAIATDYLYRGLDYGDDADAVNLLLEYQTNAGLYLGAWASKQEGGRPSYRGARELDYFLGYVTPLADSLLLDVSYSHNTFPDAWLIDYDWEEASVALHFGRQWTLLWGKNRNQFGQEQYGQVSELTHRRLIDTPVMNNFILDLSLGRVENDALPHNYSYYEIGLSHSFNNLQPRLSWITTNGHSEIEYLPRLAEKQWQFAVSYAF